MSNIVISLPNYIVQSIKESTVCPYEKYKIYEAIKDGVVLPKGHGRLVDYDKIKVEEDVYNQCFVVDAPTVLEADMEVANET